MDRGALRKIAGIYRRLSDALAVRITDGVATMACAYAFAAVSVISLPAAIMTFDPVIIVSWISSNFLQLVLLSIIMVGDRLREERNAAAREEIEAERKRDHAALAEDTRLIREIHAKVCRDG